MGDYILYSSSSRARVMSGAPADAQRRWISSRFVSIRLNYWAVAAGSFCGGEEEASKSEAHDGTPASVGQLDYIQSGVELMQESGMARA